MKLGIVFNPHKLSGRLTRLFTGCSAYHTVWVDEERGLMYDMHLIRRRRVWPHYPPEQVLLFDVPFVTREHLEAKLQSDENTYGWRDYCLFALRPIFHFLGRSTPNAGGVICSEMINNDIWDCAILGAPPALAIRPTPFLPEREPPSPCDLYRWLKGRHDQY